MIQKKMFFTIVGQVINIANENSLSLSYFLFEFRKRSWIIIKKSYIIILVKNERNEFYGLYKKRSKKRDYFTSNKY